MNRFFNDSVKNRWTLSANWIKISSNSYFLVLILKLNSSLDYSMTNSTKELNSVMDNPWYRYLYTSKVCLYIYILSSRRNYKALNNGVVVRRSSSSSHFEVPSRATQAIRVLFPKHNLWVKYSAVAVEQEWCKNDTPLWSA